MDYNRVYICLSLGFSGFAAVMGGFEMSFNAYALILKETFNFTQTEVEVVASVGVVGVALTLLETVIRTTFGYVVEAWILTIISPLCSILFGLVILYRDVLKYHLLLVSGIQLILSAVNSIIFLAITRGCMDMLPEKHMGKIVSFGAALHCLGKIFCSLLIDKVFSSNFSGFFFTLAIISLLTFGGSLFCLHPFTNDKCESENIAIGGKNGDVSDPLLGAQDGPIKNMLQSPFFHGVFWSMVLFYSCGYTCLNNVTTIAESVGVRDPLNTVYVISATIMFLRIVCGVLFDTFMSESFGFAVLQVNFVCFLVSMLIGIFALDASTMFVTTILYGAGFATTLPIGFAICLRKYGQSCYATIVGMFYVTTGAAQIILHLLFGYFFDLKAKDQGSGTQCYGSECFYSSFVVMLSVSTMANAIQLVTAASSCIGNRKSEYN